MQLQCFIQQILMKQNAVFQNALHDFISITGVCFNKHLQISFGKIVDEVVLNTRHGSSTAKRFLNLPTRRPLLLALGTVSWLTVA